MSYQMYAYRPAIGVAVAKNDKQWLLVDLEDAAGEPKVISEVDSLRLSNHLGLIDAPRLFPSFDRLKDFLRSEYLHANRASASGAAVSSFDDDLELLGRDFIVDWLRELRHCLDTKNFSSVNPRVVAENLQALARHSLYENDLEILALLHPLKNEWERKFVLLLDSKQPMTQASALAIESRFPFLNGNSLRIKESLEHFVPL